MKTINKKTVLGTMFLISLVIFAAFACKASGASGGDSSSSSTVSPEGETVDKDVLVSAISVANTVQSGVLVAESEDDVPAGAKFVTRAEMDALQDMIAAAEAVKRDENAVQAGVNTAKDALLQAIADFQANIKTGTNTDMSVANPTALLTKIAEANAAKAPVATSPTTTANAAWVTQAVMATFSTAISAASAVAMNPASTQKQADDAAAALDAAIASFTGAFRLPRAASFTSITPAETNGITTSIQLNFSLSLDHFTDDTSDLASVDISFFDGTTNADSYKSGSLTKLAGTGQYRHDIQNVAAGKTITVRVHKAGYVITPDSLPAVLNYAEPVSFLNVTGEGSVNTTSAIVLYFDKQIPSFTEGNIEISNVVGVSKTPPLDVTNAASGIYRLQITPTSAGELLVTPTMSGYYINPASRAIDLDYAATASFNSAITNEVNGTTTSVTLAFSKDVPGLAYTDFTITEDGGSGANAAATALTPRAGSVGVYDLAVTVTTPGAVTITVAGNVGGILFQPPGDSKAVTLSKATAATLESATPNIGASGTTESISLYFTDGAAALDIAGLSENDITLAGITGVTKGTLVNAGAGTYTLPISGFSTGGSLNVSAARAGYDIQGVPKTVTVTYSTNISFYLASPVNSANGLTEKLALYFSADIAGLDASDINIVKKAGGVDFNTIKGSLNPASLGEYELDVSGFTEDTEITVTVAKGGYYITTPSHDAIIRCPIAVTFSGASKNNNAAGRTTSITLTFDKAIDGLSAGNISVTKPNGSTVTGDIAKGTLGASSGSAPTFTYTLPISGMSSGGEVSVTIGKTGYTFSPSSLPLTIDAPNVNLTTLTSTWGEMTFDAETTSYALAIPSFVDKVTVAAASADSANTTLSIAGAVGASKEFTVTSIPAGLAVIVTVASPQGDSKNYSLYYTKLTADQTMRATGGTVSFVKISETQFDEVHVFKNDGAAQTSHDLQFKSLASGGLASVTAAKVLVIAGGGGGGGRTASGSSGAGGGAGGFIWRETPGVSFTGLSSGASFNVLVGKGGGGVSYTTNGANGNDSSLETGAAGSPTTLTAWGGGGGAAERVASYNGGSGGGAAYASGAGGFAKDAAGLALSSDTSSTAYYALKDTATGRQGYKGGSDTLAGPSGGYFSAAGGGGAGGRGTDVATGGYTSGGAGVSCNITGGAVTYAAGGSAVAASSVAGAADTGSGGGSDAANGGKAGGSGIVVVRFGWR